MSARFSGVKVMAKDQDGATIQGGTDVEVAVMTCTVSSMLALNFSGVPKAVKFQTLTGATDVEFVKDTATVGNAGGSAFYTMRAGQELAMDVASSGPYYFRNSAANQDSIVKGLGLL